MILEVIQVEKEIDFKIVTPISWIFISKCTKLEMSYILFSKLTTKKRYQKVACKNKPNDWQKVENYFMNTFASCQLSGTSSGMFGCHVSYRLWETTIDRQRQLLATLPNRRAMKSIIFPRSVCVACHQPQPPRSVSPPPHAASRRLVSSVQSWSALCSLSMRVGEQKKNWTANWPMGRGIARLVCAAM